MAATTNAMFEDKRGGALHYPVDGIGPLPGDVFVINIRDEIWEGPSDYAVFDCRALTQRLEQTQTKIKCGVVYHIGNISPEYMALLVSLFKKVDVLEILQFAGDAAYACLMSSLFHTDGPRELKSLRLLDASLYQANLLFEGIAHSKCLETLELDGTFEQPEEASRALIESLRRNRSLKRLQLCVSMDVMNEELHEILSTVILETKVEELNLWHDEFLEVTGLTDALCNEDCRLKTLHLHDVFLSRRSVDELGTVTNSSVTEYYVKESQVDCSQIMETAGLFRSIQILKLYANGISDLSPLDPLLLGDNVTLKSLWLPWNDVQEEDAMEFFGKLPDFKCLRHLDLSENPFIQSGNSWKAVAIDAIGRNKSLEYVNLGVHCVDDFASRTCVPLSLNRGGRRALEVESSSVLPANLWPSILERASKLIYCGKPSAFDHVDPEDEDLTFEPTKKTRADVVFWILKEKLLGHCL